MAVKKYELYYKKISEQIDTIKLENEYKTKSLAFAHWYLSNHIKLDDQQIAEALIDGADDLGIDAIILDETSETLSVFQFKFPESCDTISKEIPQADVLKTWNGFEVLVTNQLKYDGKNERFAEYKKQLENTLITQFNFFFVSYNKGVVANRSTITNKTEQYQSDYGSTVTVHYHDLNTISNIYEKLIRKNNTKINLKYTHISLSYNVNRRNITSYSGFVKASDLVEATSQHIATIFEDNIRLYEYGSKVNEGINRTATSSDQADMFYFYNNGIVLICDKSTNSPASSTIVLEGASVVNGCQTLNVLYHAHLKGKLSDEVYLPFRIIEISDYDERMMITEYLNSQTQIKASYFIANHPAIRELQNKLKSKGFFLERQINEHRFMVENGKENDNQDVIQLENSIQYYVGYWDNKNASTAKREKTLLFDKRIVDDLLSSINADGIIIALKTYRRISEILTMYRKMRRNNAKTEFSEFIGVKQDWLIDNVESFRFINTGDILLLNSVKNLKETYEKLGIKDVTLDELIRDSIYIIRELVCEKKETNTSLLTKSANFFDTTQARINNMSKRYTVNIDT